MSRRGDPEDPDSRVHPPPPLGAGGEVRVGVGIEVRVALGLRLGAHSDEAEQPVRRKANG
jgi:hypothetical protein